MNNPLRVLFFVDRLRHGGIQGLIRDIYRFCDPVRMRIDLLMLDDGTHYPLEDELRGMGMTIYQLTGVWIRRPWDYPRYFRAVDRFFAEHHDYDVVDMHSSSKNYRILQAAARHGIPVRVAHSHNTGFQSHNPLTLIAGNMMKRPMMRAATIRCGCSQPACDWLFGRGSVRRGEARVLLNGIDTQAFIFSGQTRREVRRELGLDGCFVIGHVGRFEKQKNHAFLLDVFREIAGRKPEARLVLIGIGSLMEAMRQRAEELGISGKVLFLGFRSDRERVMQAMDSFLFPSLL